MPKISIGKSAKSIYIAYPNGIPRIVIIKLAGIPPINMRRGAFDGQILLGEYVRDFSVSGIGGRFGFAVGLGGFILLPLVNWRGIICT
jgi:hypothetical protein